MTPNELAAIVAMGAAVSGWVIGHVLRDEVDNANIAGSIISLPFCLVWDGIHWVYRKLKPEPTFDEMVQATIEEMGQEDRGETEAEAEWETYLHSHHSKMRGVQEYVARLKKEREKHLAEIETLEQVVDNTSADRDQLVEEIGRLRKEKHELQMRLTDRAVQEATDAINGSAERLMDPDDPYPLDKKTLAVKRPRVNCHTIRKVLEFVWGDNVVEVADWQSVTMADGAEMRTLIVKIDTEPPHPFDW